jgi:hypothetical protein
VGGLPQVEDAVCKEADRAVALWTLLAELRAVLGWMEPALIDAMRVGAAIAAETDAALVVGAGDGEVLGRAGIAAAGVLSGVCKGAGTPVVDVPLAAAGHLRM